MRGYYNLKALIKAIRNCKTLADERVVIDRESAAIRESFREEDVLSRHASIEKLLYIFMLGYKAHFGQIECLKLVASPRFADKKLGYLGIMLLLDENTELLTMVTNSLKNDMNHANMYIVGLALCTFANISSEEMSRDLANEVEKLLGSSNVYIRRKAALCAFRIIRKVPDLIDHFAPRATSLLSDRNHGALLCGVTLVTEMCEVTDVADGFQKAVPLLVRHLKALTTTGYSPEHDVSGITDPFLQVKLLRLLRTLGRCDAESSESMHDLLAQVATNTEGTKNVGNAILYEAVLAILDTKVDTALRVMAINILGKFLRNKDNNIRYVALHTLNKVVYLDTPAVQRHRTIILDCLRDGDVSIRKRALELCYALIDDNTISTLVGELLTFLEVADTEFKLGITTQICLAADRFSTSRQWHLETVITVLQLAGNHVREDVLASFVRLVAHTPELRLYAAQRLFIALSKDLSQEALTLAGIWTLGEFGDILVEQKSNNVEDSQKVNAAMVVGLLESILLSPFNENSISQFLINASAKLCTRPLFRSEHARLLAVIAQHADSSSIESQQRAVEYTILLKSANSSIAAGVLEIMPAPDVKPATAVTAGRKQPSGRLIKGSEAGSNRFVQASDSANDPARLLEELFGLDVREPGTTTSNPSEEGKLSLQTTTPCVTDQPVAYEGHGLKVTVALTKSNASSETNILVTFLATTASGVQDINFQAAVPKTQKLQMLAIDKTDAYLGAPATQHLRVTCLPEAQIRLRLRIAFQSAGSSIREQVDFIPI